MRPTNQEWSRTAPRGTITTYSGPMLYTDRSSTIGTRVDEPVGPVTSVRDEVSAT